MRQAATILLVRDGTAGVEVFMVERNARADFGGLHVFPGGKVDPDDAHGWLAEHCVGLDDAQASARLGVAAGGLAYWIAAVRECFEESGVLLAYGPDGELIRTRDPRWRAGLERVRGAVNAGERRFADVCRETGMRLAMDRVHYFSHWITPEGRARRYDTRFFLALAPSWQDGRHDAAELVGSGWWRPADALRSADAGEITLIYPTRTSLETLARFDDCHALVAAVQAGRHIAREPDARLRREGMQPVRGA